MTRQNPAADLMALVNGFQVTQAIHVAARLGIADLLKDGPRDSDGLAVATGTHAGSLYRVLRALAAVGGRERCREQFARLFEAAGFRLSSVTPTGTRLSVIEGFPV
jgi:hypothetical protein